MVMNKNKKYIVGISLILILVITSFILGRKYSKIIIIGNSNSYSTLVTAAHIPSTSLDNYELIYTDMDKDIAIYRSLLYELDKPELEDKVTIDNSITGTVTSIDTNGFTILVDDFNEIVYGLSGTSVRSINGNYLGFISYLSGKSEVYCVSY